MLLHYFKAEVKQGATLGCIAQFASHLFTEVFGIVYYITLEQTETAFHLICQKGYYYRNRIQVYNN